jgi:hypothetical protein
MTFELLLLEDILRGSSRIRPPSSSHKVISTAASLILLISNVRGVTNCSAKCLTCATNDLRMTGSVKATERWRVEFIAENFNLLNRNNKRVDVSEDGFTSTAASFVLSDNVTENKHDQANFRGA